MVSLAVGGGVHAYKIINNYLDKKVSYYLRNTFKNKLSML